MKPNPILDITFNLGVQIMLYYCELKKDKHYSLADQIVRAGMSVGANMKEAQGAESRADFIHKCKIAYKESQELEHFLEVIKAVPLLPSPQEPLETVKIAIKVLGKIIVSAKKNGEK